jgi:hypothetical protein
MNIYSLLASTLDLEHSLEAFIIKMVLLTVGSTSIRQFRLVALYNYSIDRWKIHAKSNVVIARSFRLRSFMGVLLCIVIGFRKSFCQIVQIFIFIYMNSLEQLLWASLLCHFNR